MHAQYGETIDVVRILLDVRVTKYDGEPVTGLGPDDFTVTIGRREAPVESVRWIDQSTTTRTTEVVEAPREETVIVEPRRGRLIVVFVQTDFARERSRVLGQMNFFPHAKDLIDSLGDDDRVAVFSFDSHLKFRLDFSSDKEQVKQAVRESLLIDHPPPPPEVPEPALAPQLDRAAMKRSANPESALLLVANALRPIEGPKTLLLLGWGLGTLTSGGVRMRPQWTLARNALDAARTSIFALDMTVADYHDLEIGLMQAAEDTGGFYAKTHIFPGVAVDRVRRTLAGYYELELRRPADLRYGSHPVSVRVKPRAIVLAPQTYSDGPR